MSPLFNGRRLDLDALAGQAQALWRIRAHHLPRSASIEWLWRAVLLALFSVIIVARDALMQFNWHALPAVLLPFVVLSLAGLCLRRMSAHFTLSHLPKVALPFQAAPMLRQLQLNITAWLSRVQAMLLSQPHVRLDKHHAVQVLMLFAQRVSHNWLELRAWVEAALESVVAFAQAGVEWITSPFQSVLRAIAGMKRVPQVIALRC